MPTTASLPAPERCAAASSTRNTKSIIDAIYRGTADIPVDTVIRFQDGTTQRVRTTLRVVDLGGHGPMAEAAE